MPGMTSIDKCRIQGDINIETALKVEKKYLKPGDYDFTPYVRAIEDAVRDVELTEEDALEVARRIKRNAELRSMTAEQRKAAKVDRRTKVAKLMKKEGR